MPKKILFIGHSSRLDGAERCYLESIKALRLQGIEVVSLLPNKGPLCEKLDQMQVNYQFFEFPRWIKGRRSGFFGKIKFWLWQLWLIKNFKKLLADINPGAVVTNTIVVSPFAAIASKSAGIPHFWYIHEFGDKDHGLKFVLGKRWSGKIITQYSEKVLVNSEIIKKHFSDVIDGSKMKLLHYAVENEETIKNHRLQRTPGNGTLKLLLLGRMFTKKGQEEAVNGLYHVRKKGYSAELTLVGGGKDSYKDHLKSVAKTLQVQDCLHVVDFTPEPMKYLRDTDIVLMCSKMEAFGRVTVEAMKMGKPVIGSDSGATPEIVRDEFNGKIYESGNPEDLADKIIYFVKDREKIMQMGERAKKWSLEKFNYKVHGLNFMKIISEA